MRARATSSLLLCAVLLAAVSACARAAEDPWQKKVNLDVTDMTLETVVANLMKDAGLNYAIDRDIGEAKIPRLSFKDVPMRAAFDNLIKSAGAVYRIDNGIVLVSAKPGNQDPSTKQINLEVKDMPLSQVLESLLKDKGISYTIDPGVSDIKVTAVLKNVPFDSALRQVAKAGGIVWRIEGDVYSFAPKPGAPAEQFVPQRAVPDARIVEKIPLNWIEGGDVVSLLQMEGAVQVLSSGPQFVVVKGDEDGIERAKKMLRMLDTPDAFPRLIRVKLSVLVRAGGVAGSCTATTESVGAEGSPMPLQIRIALPSQKGAPGRPARPACDLVLQADVMPTVLAWLPRSSELAEARAVSGPEVQPAPGGPPRDTVSLTGHGMVDARQPAVFSKSFDIAASLRAKETAVIASGSADAGGQRVSFEVTATATVEEGRVKRPPDGPTRPPDYAIGGYPSAMPGPSSSKAHQGW